MLNLVNGASLLRASCDEPMYRAVRFAPANNKGSMKFIESANEYFGRYEGYNPKTQFCHTVRRSQKFAHLLVPLTDLWKFAYEFSPQSFLGIYSTCEKT